ncbi:hypothetical protein ACVIJ1_007048 [Bradyrhizobium elkanii]
MAAVWLQDCGIISSGLGLLARRDAAGIADWFGLRATLTVQKHYAYEKGAMPPTSDAYAGQLVAERAGTRPMTL